MKYMLFVSALLLLISCVENHNQFSDSHESKNNISYEPRTQAVDLSKYRTVLYVSADSINKRNSEIDTLFTSIHTALSALDNLSESDQAAVLVAGGIYSGETLEMKEFTHIYGGYNLETWKRDIEKYETILEGIDDLRIIIAGNNTTIDGFTITGGKFRGKGAAVYCEGTSPVITNNTFIDNMTLKPVDWNPKYLHETANDGGAVYGTNGASPVIKNNLFIKNKTENGRGAAIAFDGNCAPQIINNTFFKNHSGLDDPMRSSDGGAVSLFNWCKGLVEDNIFLSNLADSHNDGGAVFVALWSSPLIRKNIIVDNESGDDAGALFVGGQEHRYDAPLDPYPPKDRFYVTIENNTFIGNRNPSMNSGAMRFTMESRGEFTNNIVAQNNGVYFQRSETKITDNLILDKMLVIETKEGLGKTVITNNVIWADFSLDETDADVFDNIMLNAGDYEGNTGDFTGLIEDGFELHVYSAYYIRDKNYSELIISDSNLDRYTFDTRIVKADNTWSVVKSHKNNLLQVWGDLSGVTTIRVLPTYRLRK
jgi:hypothetical protein